MEADRIRRVDGSSRLLRYCAGIAVAALTSGATGTAGAQGVSDAQIKALQQQIDQLQRTVNQLKAAQDQATAQARAAEEKAAKAESQASQAQSQATQAQSQATQAQSQAAQAQAKAGTAEIDANGHGFLEHKKGSALTFYTPGGEITGYGNLDVSFDVVTKSVGSLPTAGGQHPIGNFGWMPDLSTNLSYSASAASNGWVTIPSNSSTSSKAGSISRRRRARGRATTTRATPSTAPCSPATATLAWPPRRGAP